VNVKMEITGPASTEALAKYATFLAAGFKTLPSQDGEIDPTGRAVWRTCALETLDKLMTRHPEAAGAYVPVLMEALADEELWALLIQVADTVAR
jgi:hypothetical protein